MKRIAAAPLDLAPARPTDLDAWLRDLLIPGWIERICRPGIPGYVEDVRLRDGAPVPSAARSTMVTCRFIYTFSLAHRFDGTVASLKAATHGLDFLLGCCRVSPGCYAHEVGEDGRIRDSEGDLYDHAFVLLALAGYAAATGRHDLLTAAAEIGDRLDRELFDPLGGYREPSQDGRRRQFPQMHLFESCQLLAALDPSGGWRERATNLIDLVDRLTERGDGIDEWYDAQWRPLGEAQHREREIGHHFEWAWLLYAHAAANDCARSGEIGDRLYRSGLKAAGIETFGPRHLVVNRLGEDGRPAAGSRPLWPTTELLRASLAAQALGRDIDRAAFVEAPLDLMFAHSIDCRTGLWANEVDEEGRPASQIIPARVLYHLVPALIVYLDQRAV